MYIYIYTDMYIYIHTLYIYILYIYIIYIYIFIYKCHNQMMLIKILKSIFYNPFQNGVHFDVFQTFSYAQSYILYVCELSAMLSHIYYIVCKILMSQQNGVN